MSNLKITVEDHPKAEERRKIFDGLHRYNASQTNDADCPSLNIFLRDEDKRAYEAILIYTLWESYIQLSGITPELTGRQRSK